MGAIFGVISLMGHSSFLTQSIMVWPNRGGTTERSPAASLNACDSFILPELDGLFQLAPKKKGGSPHAEAVAERRGKTKHTAALKVSCCKNVSFHLSVQKQTLESKNVR